MPRMLAFFAIVAAMLVAITQFLVPGVADQGAGARIGAVGHLLTIDMFSFAVGAFAGAAAVILVRFPWQQLPQIVADILRIWRRYVILTSLAGLCMGVLLFY